MRLEILTIFPEIFQGFLQSSLIGKAIAKNLLEVQLTNIRDFADPPHYNVDDTPYGGGAGMLMKPEPLARAIEDAKTRLPGAKVIFFTPAGRLFDQQEAEELSLKEGLILICGRYEGVDQRVIDLFVDLELSVGDYVLMGGEIPAMVLIEALLRLQDNVVGNSESVKDESFTARENGSRLLEAPHFTRPPVFRDREVPAVLLSGDHQKIREWREAEAFRITQLKRPDLLKTADESRK